MGRVIALIPARVGSKGIKNKNFLPLAGRSDTYDSPFSRAVICAHGVTHYSNVYATTDHTLEGTWPACSRIHRPAELAQDDTPMFDVVKHALEQIPGDPDDVVVLLQPTQPLRRPEHVQAAIQMLRETGADSVVSVTPLPLSHHPSLVCQITHDRGLQPFRNTWEFVPTRRQDCWPAYRRDGTVYAMYRRTVVERRSHDFYGWHCVPLIIPPEETCELDTPEDWAEAERRLKERELAHA